MQTLCFDKKNIVASFIANTITKSIEIIIENGVDFVFDGLVDDIN